MNRVLTRKRCTRCTLPSTFRYIRFDKQGVCNYCHNHDVYIPRFRRFDVARNLFLDQIAKIRGKYRYDCATGLSGGKDSTYILYKLVREYGLKVLALTFNNQFQNEFARQNIQRVIEDLKVDHVVLAFDPQQHLALYGRIAIQTGWPCIACSVFGTLLTQRYCFDNRIPFIVHGRAPNQMLRELSPCSNDMYLPYYSWNYRNVGFHERIKALKLQRKQLGWLLRMAIRDRRERETLKAQILLDPDACRREGFVPDFKAFFLMQDYNENEIVEFMRSKVSDEKKSALELYQHNDCLAHSAFMEIYRRAYGWSLYEFEMAFDVRDGRISKEKALELINADEKLAGKNGNSLDLICSKIGLDIHRLPAQLDATRRNIRMFQFFMRAKGIVNPLDPGR